MKLEASFIKDFDDVHFGCLCELHLVSSTNHVMNIHALFELHYSLSLILLKQLQMMFCGTFNYK